jgi:hypothetical protein
MHGGHVPAVVQGEADNTPWSMYERAIQEVYVVFLQPNTPPLYTSTKHDYPTRGVKQISNLPDARSKF